MMTATTIKRSVGFAAVIAAFAMASTAAHADVPKKVQAKFRGQILISTDPLPEDIEDTGAAVKQYKSLNISSVKRDAGDGVPSWTFYYTAFLKTAPKVSEMSLDFHTADKEKLYVANKRLQVSGTLTVITGRITISEDDGPAAGKKYDLILRAKKGRKEIELAKTTLTLK